MRLFDFVEKHNRIRMPPHLLRELSALVVAHISRRRADQTRHSVLLHVFRHVDANHRALVVKQKFSQRPRQFSLADARRPQKNKRPNRPLRIAQPGPRPADSVGHAFERFILANDPQPQTVFHIDELLDFALQHLRHRNPSPLGDDAGNVFLIHFFFQHALSGLAVNLLR